MVYNALYTGKQYKQYEKASCFHFQGGQDN